jgi:hypothetical protein
MQYEEFLDLAALYALDLLDEQQQSQLEHAIAQSPELEAEWAVFQESVGDLAYATPSVPLASDLKTRLFQRINTLDLEAGIGSSHLALAELREQANTVSWEPLPAAPGALIGKLNIDPDSRQIHCFVRAWGHVKFPTHRHAAIEEIVVLEGDLIINGVIHQRGDRISSQTGTIHQPETLNGCLLFLQTSLDDVFLE